MTTRLRRKSTTQHLPYGAVIVSILLAAGTFACGGESLDETASGAAQTPLRGGTVVVGATGVVDVAAVVEGFWSVCSGSMIAPNVVLTAAHCFDNAGARTVHSGTVRVHVAYYDPVVGRREVFVGDAAWFVDPAYDGQSSTAAGSANSDMGVVVTPSSFEGTDYRDYLRLYADGDGPLAANLTAYGAGFFSYSGNTDDHLRAAELRVENVDANHLVVDTTQTVSSCDEDSGGPLVKFATLAGVRLPLVTGVLSRSETDPDEEGDVCTNNDPPYDDDFYSRVNATKLQWIESATGTDCGIPPSTTDLAYLRCFDTPFIEDVPGEGLEREVETAIAISVL